VTVIFSMVGAEIATIAAAESDDPERAVSKAANSVITRIAIFFVGSVFLLAVILPWNSSDLEASPFVAAFQEMGIPYADDIMNAVVLTAVLSCLNSGLYTASRMLFVLAARREAPAAMVTVNSRGVPMVAILSSSVVGFLAVIMAAVSPDTVFSFLLNSSGAVILFVYLLIAVSQIILRYRADESTLKVKMWWFPALSVLTALGIVLVLVQMGLTADVRIQLVLSLASFAVVLVLFFINRRRIARLPARAVNEPTGDARRVLVLANQTLEADELMSELQRIDSLGKATYYVCVPASAVETGTASTHGAVSVRDATAQAAQERLDRTLEDLRAHHLDADGGLGDQRPLRALRAAVTQFDPDQIVIVTLPASDSIWQRFEVVDRASELGLPVTHVEAASLVVRA
jgi:GABA permease